MPPVAIADRKGEVRFEIDRDRQPALLVSHTGYRTPAAYHLPFARTKIAFTADLSEGSSRPEGGQTEQRPGEGQTIRPSRIRELPVEQAAAPGRPTRWVGEPVYIVLKNADLLETLRSFATIADSNLLFAPGIEGTINAEFPNVPWDQAFDEILRTHDLSFVVCCVPSDPPRGMTSFDQQVFIDPAIAPPRRFLSRGLGLIVPKDGRTLAPESPSLAELLARASGTPSHSPPSGTPSHSPPSGGTEPPAYDLGQFPDVPETAREPAAASPPPVPVFPAPADVPLGRPQSFPDVALFEGAAGQDGADRYPGEPIDMSLRNADLGETLRSFATISDLHWTIDPDIAGTVSVELKGVPWEQALAGILRLHDLRLEVSGHSVRIRRRDREGGR